MAISAPVDLLDPDLYDGDPTDTYRWLRQNDPVHWDPVNQLWGISRHADIVAIERHPARWSSAAGTRPAMTYEQSTTSMIDTDNPRHAEQRAIVAHDFSRRAVAVAEAQVRLVVDELIDAFAARGSAELIGELAAPLPANVICTKLGFPRPMWDELREWGDLVNNLGDGFRFFTPEKMTALMSWHAYAPEVLFEKAAHPCGDLMSLLCEARLDGQPLPLDTLVSETLLLLVGGSDTTRSSIATAVWELSRRPDQWSHLCTDPAGRLPVAVEEIVRWTTPVVNMCRTATADTELHGRTIRAGQKVLLMYGSANRDEAVFDEPDTFDVTRSPNPHVAFGFGPHLCLGINLARMEIRVALERLMVRLPDLKVEPGFVPSYNHTAFVRGYEALPVVFTPSA